MTRKEVAQAIAKCSYDELRILSELTPHECSVLLEAKLYADATIRDMPKEVYGVLSGRHNG